MSEDIRHKLGDAIQQTHSEDETFDGALLMGYVVLAEWMAPTTGRWLSVVAADANGDPLPDWQLQGYLRNVLHDWNPVCDHDDDEDDDE